jgi:hypothetical protein
MLIKVYGGTRLQDGESLCDTCVHSRIIRGRRLEEELVLCTELTLNTVQITFKVTSCSEYADNREPSYHELCEKAWILRPASRQRAAGFVRAGDLSKDEARRLFSEPKEKGG